jgi:hypothetical protein
MCLYKKYCAKPVPATPYRTTPVPATPSPTGPGPDLPGTSRPYRAWPCRTWHLDGNQTGGRCQLPSPAMPCPASPHRATPGPAQPYHSILTCVHMRYRAMPGHSQPCLARPCHGISTCIHIRNTVPRPAQPGRAWPRLAGTCLDKPGHGSATVSRARSARQLPSTSVYRKWHKQQSITYVYKTFNGNQLRPKCIHAYKTWSNRHNHGNCRGLRYFRHLVCGDVINKRLYITVNTFTLWGKPLQDRYPETQKEPGNYRCNHPAHYRHQVPETPPSSVPSAAGRPLAAKPFGA